MNKNFLRAAALASLSLFATTTLIAPQAAYAKEKKEAPKLSRKFAKPLSAANKALQAKDWKTAIASLNEAAAIEDPTPYETWVTQYYLAVAYISSGDKANAVTAIMKAVEVKDIPADDHSHAVDLGLQIIAEAATPEKVIEFVKQYVPADSKLSEGTAHNIAFAYYKMNDFENVKTYEKKAIATAEAEGKTPARYEYKLLEIAHSKLKEMPEVIAVGAKLAEQYGDDDDWNQYLDLQVGMMANKGAKGKVLETAAYYIYKLRLTTGVKAKKSDYLESAQLAHDRRLPNDVVTAIDAGVAAGEVSLSDKKIGAFYKKAKGEISADKKTLAAAESAAAKSKSATIGISVAADYLSYNEYASAEKVATDAVAKGGSAKDEAQLLLGIAQVMQNKPEAVDTLGKVSDPVMKIAADCWTTYAKAKAFKAKQAAAAAAPAPAPAQ